MAVYRCIYTDYVDVNVTEYDCLRCIQSKLMLCTDMVHNVVVFSCHTSNRLILLVSLFLLYRVCKCYCTEFVNVNVYKIWLLIFRCKIYRSMLMLCIIMVHNVIVLSCYRSNMHISVEDVLDSSTLEEGAELRDFTGYIQL